MSNTYWKYIAGAVGAAMLSLLSFFAVGYINKVEALEEKAGHNAALLEKVYEDVRWMRDNWERR